MNFGQHPRFGVPFATIADATKSSFASRPKPLKDAVLREQL
jgi:hypothetical protein